MFIVKGGLSVDSEGMASWGMVEQWLGGESEPMA